MSNYQEIAVSDSITSPESDTGSGEYLRVRVGRAPVSDTIPAFSPIQLDTDDNNVFLHRYHSNPHCDHLHEPYAALELLPMARTEQGRNASTVPNPCGSEFDQQPSTGELQDGTLFNRNEGPSSNHLHSHMSRSPKETREKLTISST